MISAAKKAERSPMAGMLKIFISSHGKFAEGIKSSLQILLGKCENITVYSAYLDESSVQEKLDEFYAGVQEADQVVLLSDLYGGSVNSVMYTYLNRENTYLITGINLALVMELAMKEAVTKQELEELVVSSREVMLLLEAEESEDGSEDASAGEEEDFF